MDDQSKNDATPDDEVEEAREIFKLSAEREEDNRAAFTDNIKFGRIGKEHQWPADIYRDRTKAGLPCLSVNRMKPVIHQVINETRQNKPGTTVRPVGSGADKWTAEVYSGLIRNIENISGADAAYDTAVDNSASGNIGYLRVVIDWAHDDSFDKDILIRGVPDVATIYGDPFSMAVDSSDWNDAFVLEKLPIKTFKKKYPGADAKNWDGDTTRLIGSPWFDKEEIVTAEWWHRDEIEKEILLLTNGWVVSAEIYAREKEIYDAVGCTVEKSRPAKSWKVTQKIMTGAEILETNPWAGKYIPIIPVFGETVVVEGKRILRSVIEDSKDPQRNLNFAKSKAAETAASAIRTPWLGEERAFTGEYASRWETANRVNWPFLAVPDGTTLPQRQFYQGPNPAEMAAIAESSDDIKATSGIYDAALGARSNETSGRAIDRRKIESDTSVFHFTDNLTRAIRHQGNILVDLIPHVYTPGRIIRVLGMDGTENQVTLKKRNPPMQGVPETYQAGDQAKTYGEGKVDFTAFYDLGVGKFDVVVSAGPGYTTRRQEAADQMIQMVQGFPQLAALCGDLIAENLDWPGADKFAERIKAMLPPQIQQLLNGGEGQQVPPQLMQQIQQGKQLIGQLMETVKKLQAELQTAKAGNDLEAMKLKIEEMAVAVDMYDAQTKRMAEETKRGEAMMQSFQNAVMQPEPARPNPAAM